MQSSAIMDVEYKTMPEHYLLCFNDECVLADECLHRLAARSGRQKDEVVTAVNPVRCSGNLLLLQALCTTSTNDLYWQYKGFVPMIQKMCTTVKRY